MGAQRVEVEEAREALAREIAHLPDEVVVSLWTLAQSHVEERRPDGATQAILDTLRIRRRPMTNQELALAIGWHRSTVGRCTRKAERQGWLQRFGNRGWVIAR
jgi:hypothetical protein